MNAELKAEARAVKAARAAAKAKARDTVTASAQPSVQVGDQATVMSTRPPSSTKSWKASYKALKKCCRALEDRLHALYHRYHVRRAHRSLQRQFGAVDGTYDRYLRAQLEETLHKKRLFGRVRFDVVPLVDMLASKY